MTDNPPKLIEPPPPPFAPPLPRGPVIAAAVFNVVALILLFLGQIVAGEVFVGLALVSGLVALFGGGSGTPASPPANPPPPTRTPQNG